MADLRSLDALRADPPDSIGALVDRLGQAGFGIGLLFVGAINLFAPVPGLGQAAAVLACLLAFQIARGARHPWLPERIRAVALPPDKVAHTLASAIPWIAWATRIARPGSLPLPRASIPLLCALPLLFMLIPLPGSNMLVAPALAISSASPSPWPASASPPSARPSRPPASASSPSSTDPSSPARSPSPVSDPPPGRAPPRRP